MQSIQVSKGSSSVKNGYESITGQINVEFKKPQLPDADWVSANLFASSTARYEANADATVKLCTLLAHYENETKTHDSNDDGFVDIPRVKQYNLWNLGHIWATVMCFRQASRVCRNSVTADRTDIMTNRHTISMR